MARQNVSGKYCLLESGHRYRRPVAEEQVQNGRIPCLIDSLTPFQRRHS
jgi:hypothetical protein